MTFQIPDELSIPRVTLLHGHDDEEHALIQPDYPAGGNKRTERAVWRERGQKGSAKKMWRFTARTRNPQTGRWNRTPNRQSNYYELLVLHMSTDPATPHHIDMWTANMYVNPRDVERGRLMGVPGQLIEADRFMWRYLLMTARTQKGMCREWGEKLHATVEHLRAGGDVPKIDDHNQWTSATGRRVYMPREHLPVFLAVAVELLEIEAAPRTLTYVTDDGWTLTCDNHTRKGTVRRTDEPEDTAVGWEVAPDGGCVFPKRDATPEEVAARKPDEAGLQVHVLPTEARRAAARWVDLGELGPIFRYPAEGENAED